MSAYRFCRTDDIGLLVDALNRCAAPHAPGQPPMTPEAFKRSIRDLQVWCSSCMVAFAGGAPAGVLIGAKRPGATLVHTIAVHPDHVRQGHGRHLLESLGSKLAILGPPRISAEVPEPAVDVRGLFSATGYSEEAVLTDYILTDERGSAESPVPGERLNDTRVDGFVIPVTVDDLDANGLLDEARPACWERSVETLRARKRDLTGLAVASDERIEAYVLYSSDGSIVALRSSVEDDGARLAHLVTRIRDVAGLVRMPKVDAAEFSREQLEGIGFRADRSTGLRDDGAGLS